MLSLSQNGLGMVRMDRTGGLLPIWAASNRPMWTLVLVLVGMCGKGSGKYMEGEMVTGDNWIFMARLTCSPEHRN